MSFAKEVSKIAAFFKKDSSPQFYKNEFTNSSLKLSDYPLIAKAMDAALPYGIIPEDRDGKWMVSITPGEFEVQWHQTSVGEHTDDVGPGWFFQFIVLRATKEVESCYDTCAQFTGYNHFGKKETTRLIREGDSVVFAPNRKHSLVYYGESVLLALRSVRKDKNAGVPRSALFTDQL